MNSCRFIVLFSCILLLTGCTEMRIDGDAKVFQSSAVGLIIGTLIGICLMVLGALSIVGSFWPDRKPRNQYEASQGGTPTSTRVALAIFGGGMGFMGFFLTIFSLLFSNKLHVTVYPDRVAMVSTINRSGGEVVVPFANLSSVEMKDEVIVGRKRINYLVFTLKDGKVIKQNAGNNERQALETIQQALAEFKKKPAPVEKPQVAANAKTPEKNGRAGDSSMPQSDSSSEDDPASALIVGTLQTTSPRTATLPPTKPSTPTIPATVPPKSPPPPPPASSSLPNIPSTRPPRTTPSAGPSTKYTLKRYNITIPLPEGYAPVKEDTNVNIGMKLGACYARRWESVTVVEVNSDGTITCSWDNWPGFIYKMVREDLTIPK